MGLRKLWRRLGKMSTAVAARRISAAKGLRGTLAPKSPRSRPGKLGGSLPARVKAGAITVVPNGFDEHHYGIDITVFQWGRRKKGHSKQPMRRIIGLSKKQQVQFAKLIGKAMRDYGRKKRAFK